MREIKFRAWDRRSKTMHAVEKINKSANPDSDHWLVYSNELLGIAGKECELLQDTGLQDKSGVAIYEGDIISLAGSVTGSEGLNPGFFFDEDDKVEIAWDADIAAWSLAGKLDRTDRVEVTYRNHAIQLIHQGACQVIGNIYENPELLEQQS